MGRSSYNSHMAKAMDRIRAGRKSVLAIAAGFLIGVGTAFAQTDDLAIKPINVDKLPASRPLLEYAMAGAFLIGALAIAFKPSKRTPQEQ